MAREFELIRNQKDGLSSTVCASLCWGRITERNLSLDQNAFLSEVAGSGASAAIVSEPSRAMHSPSDLALLQTQDTLTALHILAPSYRQLMPQRPVSLPLPAANEGTTFSRE